VASVRASKVARKMSAEGEQEWSSPPSCSAKALTVELQGALFTTQNCR
jgi:hypothetical protein